MGFNTWCELNEYWLHSPGIIYHDGGGNIHDFYWDSTPSAFLRMIGWQNNPPMCGIATMYQFSSNPNCRTRADTLMGSLDTHFWNPDAWNPYPDPGARPLELGYCWLPSFYAPQEPRADLSDNLGIAWGCTRLYKKLMDMGQVAEAMVYLARAENIFNSILTEFEYDPSELIGLMWNDVSEINSGYDVPQFIGIHDHYYDGNGTYCRRRNKCTGCNLALLNALYYYFKMTDQWP